MIQAIKVDNLVKSYGSNSVIKGISFEIGQGEIIALLGTNGAGKTTTLKCIEGLRKYNGGKITVNGKIGVQLQSSSLPESIKAIEAYNLFCGWNKAKPDYEQFSPRLFRLWSCTAVKLKRLTRLDAYPCGLRQ